MATKLKTQETLTAIEALRVEVFERQDEIKKLQATLPAAWMRGSSQVLSVPGVLTVADNRTYYIDAAVAVWVLVRADTAIVRRILITAAADGSQIAEETKRDAYEGCVREGLCAPEALETPDEREVEMQKAKRAWHEKRWAERNKANEHREKNP